MKYRYKEKTWTVHIGEPDKNENEIIEIPDGSIVTGIKRLPEGEMKELDKPNKLGNLFEVVTQKCMISYLEPVEPCANECPLSKVRQLIALHTMRDTGEIEAIHDRGQIGMTEGM